MVLKQYFQDIIYAVDDVDEFNINLIKYDKDKDNNKYLTQTIIVMKNIDNLYST